MHQVKKDLLVVMGKLASTANLEHEDQPELPDIWVNVVRPDRKANKVIRVYKVQKVKLVLKDHPVALDLP